ncbi:MAG: hypothetical protein JWR36_80 [Glaciihabitans sp.]|jgi:regulation of enolase protein 1 (concanavalin A-like superfamily)|nr:hypothetical protein [Glaciihabitans sp.]
MLAGFENAEWLGEPVATEWDEAGARLTLTARGQTDWINDAVSGSKQANSSALLINREGDFSLRARVEVDFAGTYDAGVLCLWQNADTWAKLCFEFSPQGQPMVVSVVTREFSDDVNSVPVAGNVVHLRVSRIGEAYAFHSSTDGASWDFVRVFRLGDAANSRVGLMAQSPVGDGCSVTFSEVSISHWTPSDLRSGE